MTEDESIEWFNKVKGKRIRWNDWPASSYITPTDIYRDERDRMRMRGVNEKGESDNGFVVEGFNSEEGYSTCWEFWKFPGKMEATLNKACAKIETHKCNCDLEKVVMVHGCQCGGV